MDELKKKRSENIESSDENSTTITSCIPSPNKNTKIMF